MFSKAKLGTKIALGYLLLVTIAGILGLVGWKGVSDVGDDMITLDEWNTIDMVMNEGVIQNVLHVEGDMAEYHANPSDDQHNKVEESIQNYSKGVSEWSGLVKQSRDLADIADEAKTVADSLVKDLDEFERLEKEEAQVRERWDAVIDRELESVDKVMENLVDPARRAAIENNSLEDLMHWSAVDMLLNENVIAQLLKLEISAHEYMDLKTEKAFKSLVSEIGHVKDSIGDFETAVSGNHDLEKIARDSHSNLEDFESFSEEFHNSVTRMAKLDDEMDKDLTRILDKLHNTMESVIDPAKTAAMEDADNARQTSAAFSLVFTISGILLGIFLAVVITRSITKPLNRVIDGMSQGAEQVSTASEQISSGSQQIAQGASEQASSLEEVSSSLQEMSSMTTQNAGNASEARNLATEARNSARMGNEAMQRMADTITQIQTSSNDTAKIVKTIDEIAFQTNLLALNAAVEAARAGEAGKGFAVVAEEVRNLAQRSAEAAKNTADLIAESQKNTENGVTVSGEVESMLKAIVESIERAANLIAEVAAASDEQAQGISQVNVAVTQMSQVTQENAANAEEASSASEELSAQSQELNSMVILLNTLVSGAGGSSNGNGFNGNGKHKTFTERKTSSEKTESDLISRIHQVLATSAKAANEGKSNGGNGNGNGNGGQPEQVIPLGEEDKKALDEF